MEETIRYLIFVGLAALLLVLRLDARRFGTADHHDEWASETLRIWLRRLTWFVLAVGLIVAIYQTHRLPISQLHLQLGDDRQQAITLGLAAGLGGTLVAVLFAWARYRRLRLPPGRQYPGAALNAIGTAFVDEALFRGVLMGLLLTFGVPGQLAVAVQAVGYGLATRVGAPNRSLTMLVLAIVVGLVTGFLTLETQGIGAAIVAHGVTRFAFFLATGHAGIGRVHGREPEEQLGPSLPPDGWEVVDHRMPDAGWGFGGSASQLGAGGAASPAASGRVMAAPQIAPGSRSTIAADAEAEAG